MAESEPEEITVFIKSTSSADRKLELSVSLSLTVLELKEKISAKNDVPTTSMRLIHSGRVLKDGDALSTYKIQSGHTIHLAKSVGARSATSTSNTSNSAVGPSSNTANPSNAPPAAPQNLAAGRGTFNPAADLTGARYAGFAQLPSMDMFGPDGGMQLPSEDEMERIIDSPAFQQGLDQVLDNPQMLNFLINQNPQLREMGPLARQFLQDPAMRQMISNPQMRRQMMEMSRAMGGLGHQTTPFPAPGSQTDTSTNSSANATNDGTRSESNTTQNTNANPFAQLFPGGAASSGANPFAAFASGANATQQRGLPSFDPSLLQSILAGNAAHAQGSSNAPVAQDTRPPEERYEQQLRQLNDMGFNDFDANVRALRRSGGSVQGAIENLLNGI